MLVLSCPCEYEIVQNSRVSDQNGVSLLYIMLKIHHSGQEPSKYVTKIAYHRGRRPSNATRNQYHGGRRPSRDDCPTVIPPTALNKPSIIRRYHGRRTCSHTSPRRSPTFVGLHDTGPRTGIWYVYFGGKLTRVMRLSLCLPTPRQVLTSHQIHDGVTVEKTTVT